MDKLVVSESEILVTFGSITAHVTQPEAVKLITQQLAENAISIIRGTEDNIRYQERQEKLRAMYQDREFAQGAASGQIDRSYSTLGGVDANLSLNAKAFRGY